jgi:3-oxoacyl-[acyl-carrier protein] reductase
MADRLQDITNSAVGGAVTKRLGIPTPPILDRHEPGKPVVSRPVLIGEAPGGRLVDPLREVLTSVGAEIKQGTADGIGEDGLAALVYDATGISDSGELGALYEFFHAQIGSLGSNGRIIVLATPPAATGEARAHTAQRAIEGLTRSLGKEIGRSGATAQLVRVAPGAEGAMESTLRFLLSARSAFVDGQVIAIEPPGAEIAAPGDWEKPLDGQIAAVTGAARGIGESIAEVLASLGANVVAIDIPAAGEALTAVANRIGATALNLDITGSDAPDRLAEQIGERQGSLDVMVHNAGITRDKTIKKMERENWDAVLDVNLTSQERINDALLERDLLGSGGKGGRIITVSSVSGIAGNRGQTNYATTKAGVIGMVEALAPQMRERRGTINAVAPGFIETAMTAKMPIGTREGGRRTSSLLQGGQPVDVAETIGWLASPASSGVNGNVVRVCGQALIGA